MEDTFLAHWNEITKEMQSVLAHNRQTARLAEEICPIQELSGIAWLSGILHDSGKYLIEFQQYLKAAINDPDSVKKGSVVHSTLGGLIIEALAPKTTLAEMIQIAVFSHHGLNDCFSLETGELLREKRNKNRKEDEEAKLRYFQYITHDLLTAKIESEKINLKCIMININVFAKSGETEGKFGSREFYLGMYQRLLMSVLVDCDRLDTAIFMHNREETKQRTREEMHALWCECADSLENKLETFRNKPMQKKSRLDDCRAKISDACKMAAYNNQRLYRLTVPTGGGKTLSSLRFALYRAREQNLDRIVYVVSFNSILEQNASEIRDALQRADIILEHHSNVIFEKDGEEEKRYQLLTENWNSPFIVTSAVQLLNTLFSSGTGNVRRMHSLCSSVIIFDEVQALPVRITKLFNLAVNFLTKFCNSTVVLCSATQPPFEQLDSERMLPAQEMAGGVREYKKIFKRCTITDLTNQTGGQWGIQELVCFVQQVRRERDKILIIVNTKACAEHLFYGLKKVLDNETTMLFHLSTNMCPKNRQEILGSLRKILESDKPVICVSTQLIEAGIDISFQCVIRSLAGLDNVIQAAGRCNRHGEIENGDVYVVELDEKAENVSRMKDIPIAQASMRWLLGQYRAAPENFDYDLASDRAISLYYQYHMNMRLSEMSYEASVGGIKTSIVQLLSSNTRVWEECRRNHGKQYQSKYPAMRQFFKTAGDLFEVIPEDGKIDIVVEYDKTAMEQINVLQNEYSPWEEQKAAIKNLQPYIVGISEQQRKKLGNAIHLVCGGRVFVLSENYYNKQTGVSESPVGMEFLDYGGGIR